MSARVPAHDGNGGRTSRTRTACSAAAGVVGLAGSLACGAAMILAGLGLGASTTTTGMAGMVGMDRSGNATRGLLGLLLRAGPGLLVASTVLIALAFALKRLAAAAPTLLAGAVLYAGTNAQPNLTLMYLSIAVGYAGWALLYRWVRTADHVPADRTTEDPDAG
jgi:hypothetical protein